MRYARNSGQVLSDVQNTTKIASFSPVRSKTDSTWGTDGSNQNIQKCLQSVTWLKNVNRMHRSSTRTTFDLYYHVGGLPLLWNTLSNICSVHSFLASCSAQVGICLNYCKIPESCYFQGITVLDQSLTIWSGHRDRVYTHGVTFSIQQRRRTILCGNPSPFPYLTRLLPFCSLLTFTVP